MLHGHLTAEQTPNLKFYPAGTVLRVTTAVVLVRWLLITFTDFQA